MPRRYCAHRKSVASKAATTKAMSALAKTAATARTAAVVPDAILPVQTANAAANATIVLCMGSLVVFEADAGPKDEIAKR
jgi:hypothetical protein